MAKLYFYYSAMNAGKSTTLLQSSYNYQERGMNTLILAPDIDNREDQATVTSRIGLSANATTFHLSDNLYQVVEELHQQRETAIYQRRCTHDRLAVGGDRLTQQSTAAVGLLGSRVRKCHDGKTG